jgi:hypothetical protein
MKFDVFSKANFKPNASSNSVDSSPDPPVVHEELVEEAVESEFTQKASPGDTESAPDAATDVVVIVDTQSNEEAIDASPDPNEAVADTTNEGAEQNVSDWEKGDVSDIASIADPSETKPSEQLEAKKLPGDAQDEKSETPQERIGTVPEDDVGSTAEATEPVEVDDTAHPAPFDELLTSQVISASDEISLIDETIEQALVDIPDQGGADIANTDAGAQFVDTTTIQETLEAEPTPEQPDAPESLEPDAGAPEPEASIDEPQVDEPKPARTIPDAEDSEQPVDSSAPVGPDDVVAMETPGTDIFFLCAFIFLCQPQFHAFFLSLLAHCARLFFSGIYTADRASTSPQLHVGTSHWPPRNPRWPTLPTHFCAYLMVTWTHVLNCDSGCDAYTQSTAGPRLVVLVSASFPAWLSFPDIPVSPNHTSSVVNISFFTPTPSYEMSD